MQVKISCTSLHYGVNNVTTIYPDLSEKVINTYGINLKINSKGYGYITFNIVREDFLEVLQAILEVVTPNELILQTVNKDFCSIEIYDDYRE